MHFSVYRLSQAIFGGLLAWRFGGKNEASCFSLLLFCLLYSFRVRDFIQLRWNHNPCNMHPPVNLRTNNCRTAALAEKTLPATLSQETAVIEQAQIGFTQANNSSPSWNNRGLLYPLLLLFFRQADSSQTPLFQ